MVNDVTELAISEKLRKPGTTVAKGREYDADVTYLLDIIKGLREIVLKQVVPSHEQLKELSRWRSEASYKKAELIERMRKVETLLK